MAYPPAVQAALDSGILVIRDYIWITARNRVTGDPVPDGYWSDVGATTALVDHPELGEISRTFSGAGGLIEVDNVPSAVGVSAETITVKVSHLNERIRLLLHQYDCKQAQFEMYRGFFDPITRLLLAPATCEHYGFVENVKIITGEENEESYTELIIASPAQEFNRYNPATRSNPYQFLRDETDNFFEDTIVMSELEFFWGTRSGKLDTQRRGGGGGNEFGGVLR